MKESICLKDVINNTKLVVKRSIAMVSFIKDIKSGYIDFRKTLRIRKHIKMRPEDYPSEIERMYKEFTGKKMDIKNPKSFNEKIQWTKAYGIEEKMTKHI